MNQFYAEFRCLSVAFALWGNRCQSVAITHADGTILECKNPLFVLDPESWWHSNKLDAIILAGPDPKGIALLLRQCAEGIHIAHIRVNKPPRCDEGIWQIRQANKKRPHPVVTQLLDLFDQTARRCKSRIRYLLAKIDYFDGTPWPAGEREIAKWEADDEAGPSA